MKYSGDATSSLRASPSDRKPGPRIAAGIFACLLVALPIAFCIGMLVQPDLPTLEMAGATLALVFFAGLPMHFFLGYRFPWILPSLVALLGLCFIVVGWLSHEPRLLVFGTPWLVVALAWNFADMLPEPLSRWITDTKERWTR